ncbi:helix-turn-helix domain-containing protein [Amycolatopsis mongoliensis]|uniref:Helix-turn-helix domain-containing protein n=1 Tax=Amycolatopsis mongoliensis TaxID=715475 RepID=A0A9Y2JIU7_9PSEU|nr:helix-turn-helix domain-containing protein [Amycolatopsis sp. 4-36]WIX98852.1 helix-turn-helix domain-containing protein [Amycolatopsis sp. 4-36]
MVEVQRGLGAGGARSLSPEALEQLRRRAVAAVESGVSQTRVASTFGVSRKAVGTWVRAYRSGGEPTLRPRPRGRRAGERLVLSAAQQGRLVEILAAGPPDEAGLPWLLWTRKAVADLIAREFGVVLAGTTIDKYLLRWELIGRAGAASRRAGCPPGTVLVTWTHPRSPAGTGRLHALVAVSGRGTLHFLARAEPFTGIAEFRHRLRMQLGRDVRMVPHDWPAAHPALLDDRGEPDQEFVLPA